MKWFGKFGKRDKIDDLISCQDCRCLMVTAFKTVTNGSSGWQDRFCGRCAPPYEKVMLTGKGDIVYLKSITVQVDENGRFLDSLNWEKEKAEMAATIERLKGEKETLERELKAAKEAPST